MPATLEMPTLAPETFMPAISAPLSLTDAAAAEVTSLIAQQDRTDLALRVYVAGGGCSGLQYGMALDENIEPGDETFAFGPITLVVDSTSLRYLTGAVVDYIHTDMGGGFKIENPNATKSCGGCGSCGSH